MSVTRELDVRTIPSPSRNTQIFDAFDGLAPDEAFVLVSDQDPKPHLYQLQGERPGRFDWSVLEAGPRRFRVEIRRRRNPGARSVSECLETDHRRLDAMVPDISALVEAEAFEQASARFAELSCGLARHIDIEEQLLFPVFERSTGMSGGGPTAVMRREHRAIIDLMQAVENALAARDAAAYAAAVDELGDILGEHNEKEEQVLYPMTDDLLGDDRARDDLVKRMQAF